MQNTYQISGMTCDGCRGHVERILNQVEGIEEVSVNLQTGEAILTMKTHVPLEKMQEAMAADGGRYGTTMNDGSPHHEHARQKTSTGKGTDTYYCPMHCEGETTYNQPGNCPVCGMDLVQVMSSKTTIT